jgi:acetate kinase
VTRQSGLLGISEFSADMHDLLERETREPAAAEAIELFSYQAKKFLCSLAGALGGAGHGGLHGGDRRKRADRTAAHLRWFVIHGDRD